MGEGCSCPRNIDKLLLRCLQALLLERVDRLTGREVGLKRSVGAGSDSYYEYLLKCVLGCVAEAGALEAL